MFLPPRMQRLPLSGRSSKAPKLTFIFKDLLVECFFIFAALLSLLCMSQKDFLFFLPLQFVFHVYVESRDASTVGCPERLVRKHVCNI